MGVQRLALASLALAAGASAQCGTTHTDIEIQVGQCLTSSHDGDALHGFLFRVTTAGSYTFSSCGSFVEHNTDTQLHLYGTVNGQPDFGNVIGYNDDAWIPESRDYYCRAVGYPNGYSLDSQVTATLAVGEYYIRVGSLSCGFAEGPFAYRIQVSQDGVPNSDCDAVAPQLRTSTPEPPTTPVPPEPTTTTPEPDAGSGSGSGIDGDRIDGAASGKKGKKGKGSPKTAKSKKSKKSASKSKNGKKGRRLSALGGRSTGTIAAAAVGLAMLGVGVLAVVHRERMRRGWDGPHDHKGLEYAVPNERTGLLDERTVAGLRYESAYEADEDADLEYSMPGGEQA